MIPATGKDLSTCRRPLHGAGAFSLLEMVVASVILAAGLVVVLESVSSGLEASGRTDREAIAHRIAADRLNRAAAGESPDLGAEHSLSRRGTEYRWHVEEIASSGGPGGRALRCTVQWRARNERRRVVLERRVPAGLGP